MTTTEHEIDVIPWTSLVDPERRDRVDVVHRGQRRVVVVRYEPGNMTRYEIAFTDVTDIHMIIGDTLTSIITPHLYTAVHDFPDGRTRSDPIHVGYLATKLSLVRSRATLADILPIARVVAWGLGRDLVGAASYAGKHYADIVW